MRFLRALIVLHRAFSPLALLPRLHVLIRFLTCPMLRIVERIPVGASLLDVGAGHGLFACLASNSGAGRVVGIEPDLRKVRALSGAHLVAGYDESVRGTHDVVSVIDVLYKIPLAEWDALLARLASRLPEGGLLLIKEQDPTARFKNGWNRLQERVATTFGLTLGEAFSYETPADFTSRLRRHGFDSMAERIDRFYPHPHILYVAKKRASSAGNAIAADETPVLDARE